MPTRNRCANATCSCTTREGQLYCSEYCEQAVGQAVERHYCQCEHACDPATLTETLVLRGSDIHSKLEPELQPIS
jgi:hypothetical protein